MLQFLKLKEYSEKVPNWTWNPTVFGKLGISQPTCGIYSGSYTLAGASFSTHTLPLYLPLQCKEEAVGTLDAVQVLASISQLLPKTRENYLNRCMDQERLRRESTSQKEMDKVSPWLQVPSRHQPMQVQ